MTKHTQILQAKNFDELLDIQYGVLGTKEREEFEQKAKEFIETVIVKEKEETTTILDFN